MVCIFDAPHTVPNTDVFSISLVANKRFLHWVFILRSRYQKPDAEETKPGNLLHMMLTQAKNEKLKRVILITQATI
ncbi:hypothetical protein RN38_04015 [Hafnia paralvei]|nr:hypothetical protein RN38_04015 [Hafnia paralvei]